MAVAKSHLLIAVALAIGLFTLHLVAVNYAPTVLAGLVNNTFFLIESILSGLAFTGTALLVGRRDRQEGKAWMLIALAAWFWMLGDAGWTILDSFLGRSPYPSICDFFYIGSCILFLCGVLRMPHPPLQAEERLKLLLDLGAGTVLAGLLTANFLIEPVIESSEHSSGWLMALSAGYPFCDFVMFLSVLYLLVMQSSRDRGPIGLLAAGAILMVAADGLFSIGTLKGTYSGFDLCDPLWAASSIIWALAGLWKLANAASHRAQEPAPPAASDVWSLYLLSAWLGIGFILLIARPAYDLHIPWLVLVTGGLGVTLLVAARLHLAWRDNRVLLEQLRQTHDELEQRVRERTAQLEQAHVRLEAQSDQQRQAEKERHALDLRVQQSLRTESLGVLAGGLAHDFNNLLVSMLGNAELAMDQLPTDHPARPFLTSLYRSSIRATELTQQLQVYSGRSRLDAAPVNLAEAIDEAWSMSCAAPPPHIRVKFDLAPDLPKVWGDRSQIRQAIFNLLVNALEALGEKGGAITVTASLAPLDPAWFATFTNGETLDDRDHVKLTVSDNGPGMEEAVRVRIFDPFFTTKFAGRGLGLSAVLGILRGHRGAIRVESHPGVGTAFTMLLPLVPVSCPSTVALEQEGPAAASRVILVVDDEEAVRQVLAAMLKREGYEVMEAKDGREGVELVKRHGRGLAIVLLDLTMPVMNGETACRAMRELAPLLPILLISGYPEREALRQVGEVGANGFLHKPFSRKQLMERINQHVAVPVPGQPRSAKETANGSGGLRQDGEARI